MKLTEYNKDELNKLIKLSSKIEIKFIDKNYEVDYLPDLLDFFHLLSKNVLCLETHKKKVHLLLNRYYTNRISSDELAILGYTDTFKVLLDKKDIEASIEVHDKYIYALEKYEEEKLQFKKIDIAIQRYKFKYQDIKNIISYRQMVGG